MVDVTLSGLPVGNADQFELLSKPDGFQLGEIRFCIPGGTAGPNGTITQYLLRRLLDVDSRNVSTTPTYATNWLHLRRAVNADLKNGVNVRRIRRNSTVSDKWYVNSYAWTEARQAISPDAGGGRKSFPVPGYPPNGFLAIEYEARTGPLESGEKFHVTERWSKGPKSPGDLLSSEDVYPFRETELTIRSVTEVSGKNLLPAVSFSKTGLRDYRLPAPAGREVLFMPFKRTHWIVSGDSKNWKTLKAAALRAKPNTHPEVNTNNRRMARFFLVFTALIPLVFIIAGWRRGKKRHKHVGKKTS